MNYRYEDTTNGLEVRADDHTVRIESKEAVTYLTPEEAHNYAAALVVAAGEVADRREKAPSAVDPTRVLSFVGAILSFSLLGLITVSPARASPCYSIRDVDKRLECLAVERSDPNGCHSIRDWDQKQICRNRSRQGAPPRRSPFPQ